MSPSEIDLLLRTARGLLQAGQRAPAEMRLRQILGQHPDHDGALHWLGIVALQSNRPDLAIEPLRQAAVLQPNVAAYHGALGDASKSLGMLDEAVASYRRALELKPTVAEGHNELGNALVRQGKLDEAIVCYRRALDLKPDVALTHYCLGFALQSQGKLDDAVVCYRRALELKPDDAAVYNNLGFALQEQHKFDEAVASYRRSLELMPDTAQVHNNLGNALLRLGMFEEAVACYRRALELKPDDAESSNNLGNALMTRGKADEAVDCYRRTLVLKPDHAEAHNNLGAASQDLRKLDDAEVHLSEAIRLRPNYNSAQVNRSYLSLLRGDFERGWKEYELRLHSESGSARTLSFSQPKWDGSPLQGRTILLHCEQGLGDTLQFVRYARMVADSGGNVIVECQPALKRLLQNSLGPIPVIDFLQPQPAFDVHYPIMSLPFAFQTTLETIPRQAPYIHADAESIALWRNRIADDGRLLKVGLAWAGSKTQAHDHYRSMALRDLAPLGDVPGVRLYSLQKGEPAQQVLAAPAGMKLIDWSNELHDFADTAALIANLDLVISVCTSVAHLAGAMGKQVWTLLSFAADWRWLLDRDDSPWYPTMRLFRQPSLGDWPSTVERVADSLRQRASGKAVT